jgi:hypothetical protein
MAIDWSFFFSNKNYQTNIEVFAYILREDQIQLNTIFGEPVNLHQLQHKDLINPKNYLLVRLKNKGNQGAWGSLIININGVKYIKLEIPFLGSNMTKFSNYLLPLELVLPEDDHIPKIETEWAGLYSK